MYNNNNNIIIYIYEHWMLQVIGFLLYLTDGDKVNINKLKQLNLCQVDTIFKVSRAVSSQPSVVEWFLWLLMMLVSNTYLLPWLHSPSGQTEEDLVGYCQGGSEKFWLVLSGYTTPSPLPRLYVTIWRMGKMASIDKCCYSTENFSLNLTLIYCSN